jgi:hypothetical protein
VIMTMTRSLILHHASRCGCGTQDMRCPFYPDNHLFDLSITSNSAMRGSMELAELCNSSFCQSSQSEYIVRIYGL